MTDINAIFDRLRASGLNDWVGGGDPGFVGGGCYYFLNRAVTLADDLRVLDFGCGIGRVALAYLYERPAEQIVGFDIMAPVIDFCRAEIEPKLPNTRFELVDDHNAHYASKAGEATGKSRAALAAEYARAFDLAYAFSVFTHVEADDLAGLFAFVAKTLKPGANFYITAFLLTPHSRARIAKSATTPKFPKPAFERDGTVFVGNTDDRLAFIAFDPDLIHEAAEKAGLFVIKTETGSWTGDDQASDASYQDVIVLRKSEKADAKVDVAEIYALLRGSEMNAWVGGDDPERVGEMCAHQLRRTIPRFDERKVLDFGCGIGRTILAVLRETPRQDITGFDIMPPVIDFCRREIASRFPATRFELVADANDHYEKLAANVEGKSKDQILAEYGGAFEVAYAFSVFTHVDKGDFQPLIEFVARTLRPGGYLYFTMFLLTRYSRERLAADACKFKFERSAFEEDGKVFVGDTNDRLAFIAYDLDLLLEMARGAGLFVHHLEFGGWSGGDLGGSLQDVVVLRRPYDSEDQPRL